MSDERDDRDDLDARAEEWGGAPALAALAMLAGLDATTPPAELRHDVLAHAARSPRPHAEPAPPPAVYGAQVEVLWQLLGELAPQDWALPALPYQWTIHGLLAHLLVIERYTARRLGLPADADGEPTAGAGNDELVGHLELGAEDIAAELAADAPDTARRWHAAAQRLAHHVRSAGFGPDESVTLHGWPFTAATALIARSFELWTHADDVRRATGRSLAAPGAGELRAMSSFSVTSLPALLPLAAPDVPMASTRIVLTGPGGGTYDLHGPQGRPTLVVTDVVDYCRVVARRIAPDELVLTVDGDERLASALLRASSVFAV